LDSRYATFSDLGGLTGTVGGVGAGLPEQKEPLQGDGVFESAGCIGAWVAGMAAYFARRSNLAILPPRSTREPEEGMVQTARAIEVETARQRARVANVLPCRMIRTWNLDLDLSMRRGLDEGKTRMPLDRRDRVTRSAQMRNRFYIRGEPNASGCSLNQQNHWTHGVEIMCRARVE
jgi:hypothetical protein